VLTRILRKNETLKVRTLKPPYHSVEQRHIIITQLLHRVVSERVTNMIDHTTKNDTTTINCIIIHHNIDLNYKGCRFFELYDILMNS